MYIFKKKILHIAKITTWVPKEVWTIKGDLINLNKIVKSTNNPVVRDKYKYKKQKKCVSIS